MRIIAATISVVLISLLGLPALVGYGQATEQQFRQITTLVTAPLSGGRFRCSLVVVGADPLTYQIQIFGPAGPNGPVLGQEGGTGFPGSVHFAEAIREGELPAYCRIRLFGVKDKDLVRGALQVAEWNADGSTLSWTSSTEAR